MLGEVCVWSHEVHRFHSFLDNQWKSLCHLVGPCQRSGSKLMMDLRESTKTSRSSRGEIRSDCPLVAYSADLLQDLQDKHLEMKTRGSGLCEGAGTSEETARHLWVVRFSRHLSTPIRTLA